MSTANQLKKSPDDESQIRQLLEHWRAALSARDLDQMMEMYSPDVIFFDAVPPYEHRGRDAYRQTWENMLQLLPKRIESEVRDVSVTVSGDTAFMHCLNRLVCTETGEHATCGWVRVTVCYQRIDNHWKVIHEHVSVPFDPHTGHAGFIRELRNEGPVEATSTM